MDEVSCEADFRAFRTCVNTYRMCECEHRDEFCFIFTLFCWFFWCMGIFYLLYGGQLLRVHGTLSGYTQTNTRITNTYNIKRLYAEKGGIVRFHFFFYISVPFTMSWRFYRFNASGTGIRGGPVRKKGGKSAVF